MLHIVWDLIFEFWHLFWYQCFFVYVFFDFCVSADCLRWCSLSSAGHCCDYLVMFQDFSPTKKCWNSSCCLPSLHCVLLFSSFSIICRIAVSSSLLRWHKLNAANWIKNQESSSMMSLSLILLAFLWQIAIEWAFMFRDINRCHTLSLKWDGAWARLIVVNEDDQNRCLWWTYSPSFRLILLSLLENSHFVV